MKKTIVFIADANPRAVIASLRALSSYHNLNIYGIFRKKSYFNFITLSEYRKKVDSSYCYHSKNKNDFIKSIIHIRKKIGPFELMPNGERFLRWILEAKKKLSQFGITINAPDVEAYKIISNKKSFQELCNIFGISTPLLIDLPVKSFSKRFVVKAKKIEIKRDVLSAPMLIENIESYNKLMSINIDWSRHFAQEYISGPSYYYCAGYENGLKKIEFTQKNLVQQPGGKSIIKALPSCLPLEITEKIDKMMNSLFWNGVMMLELKYCSYNNNYYAIECNPRLWGPLQIAIDNGINFPAFLIGERNTPGKNKQNHGYLWLSGYFQGLQFAYTTKTKFQYYPKEKQKIFYKDVWLRSDSYKYFFWELITTPVSLAKLFFMDMFVKGSRTEKKVP